MRAELDRALALYSNSRQTPFNRSLTGKMVALFEQASIVGEHLQPFNGTRPKRTNGLTELQEHASAVREFADRARTAVAVKLAQTPEIRTDISHSVDDDLRRAEMTWKKLRAIASHVELSAATTEAIERAERHFFRSYKSELRLIGRIDRIALPGEIIDSNAVDFVDFYARSSKALTALMSVADAIQLEILDYWQARNRSAEWVLCFWLVAFAALAALLLATYVFLDRRLVRRIESASAALGAVAQGDLGVRTEPRTTDVAEIAELYGTLERFRSSLRRAREAEREARTDILTGLPNRRHLDDLLSGASGEPIGPGDVFGVLDLDDFKPINDNYGHDVGDAVLKAVADRIRYSQQDLAEIWRLGGDEFGILWRNQQNDDQVMWRAEQLVDDLTEPVKVGRREIVIGVSAGLASYDDAMVNTQEIVSRADFAMFVAKQRPTPKVEHYSRREASLGFGIHNRRKMLQAFQNEEFESFFQPQYCLETGGLIGFEALARWRRPDGKVLPPGQFLTILQHQELQSRLDIVILEKSVETIGRWRRRHPYVPKMSVNMSEETLASEESRNRILEVLSQHAEDAEKIVIEVTENALIDRSASAIRQSLEAFARCGAELSMDDFGTGYGSFRHLKEYRFDEVKIDRSFVQSLETDAASHVIIEGFVAIAKGLDARVVAEGVETKGQLQRLLSMGCAIGQGYHFGKPVAAAEAEQVLAFAQAYPAAESA